MNTINLNTETALTHYNWFHHAFNPSYRDDERCGPQDVMEMKKLERFLIASGK